MDDQNKKLLLNLARKAIEHKLNGRTADEFKRDIHNLFTFPEVYQKAPVLVTLTMEDDLRGSFATMDENNVIVDAVITNAINAASRDTRFFPVTPTELPKIKIEISILSSMVMCNFDDVQVSDGISIFYDGRQATFLPIMWSKYMNKEEFISKLCEKAKLPDDVWRVDSKNMQYYKFNAETFRDQ